MTFLLTSNEAAQIIGIADSTFNRRAKQAKLRRRKVSASKGVGGTGHYLYRREDVEKMAKDRLTWKGRNETLANSEIRSLVSWADGLDVQPSNTEIESRASYHYRFKDIESVLENRVARGLSALTEARNEAP